MRSKLPLLLLVAACGGSHPAAPPASPASEPQNVAPAPPATPSTPVATPSTPPEPTKPVTNASLASVGLDPDALDKSADPCDDFYQFACGGWVQKTEIPADKPMAMRSFVDIDDRNLAYEHDVLEALRKKPGKDPVSQKLSAFYSSCMDEPAIERAGISPLKPLLAVVEKIHDQKSLDAAVTQLHAAGYSVLFNFGSTQDSADATRVIASIDQGGLGLPDRDYYLQLDNPQYQKARTAYLTYVEAMLKILGHKNAKDEAQQILDLETSIAKVSKDKVARRDPKTMYNRLDREGVAKAMPDFDWDGFWKGQKLPDVKEITVGAPDFFKGLDELLKSTKPELWRTYLSFHLISKSAGLLSKQVQDTQFAFGKALTGTPEQPPRWKKCVRFTDGSLGDLLGQVFVHDKFGGKSKEAAEEQVHAIVSAMTANLAALPWMDAQTKARAADKLKAMTYQIGYPNKWKTYDFKVGKGTWGANALAARKADEERDVAKIGKPVDKDDWQMTAPTVNAYYDPQLNGMVFPAGILQPPFYSVDNSIPVNLGGMGVVVGHELTHGFDDQGAQYDELGNLKEWWQPETEKRFKARTQCVIDQYGTYEVSDHVKLNGANTVGENIADIGGVKLAFTAYRSLRSSSPNTVVADGFTEDQQFFLGFGQAWCAKMRPDFEKMLASIDVHSPARWRVDGALSATPEFARAFHCKAASKMQPAKQCVVW
ncbi:MAG TPA: M13 family metallopeptidase [Kofleriaceae bacterium]|jgi:putative endopeptidase